MMRRLIQYTFMAVLTLSNMGCIMVLGVENPPSHKHVVQIDGELYLVDDKTLDVQKIEPETATYEETTIRTEVEVVDE